MSELEPRHSQEILHGTRMQLNIVDPDAIRMLLEQKSNPHALTMLNNSSADELPSPIKNARLELWHMSTPQSNAEPVASISFLPPKGYEDSWQDDIQQELFARVDEQSDGEIPDVDEIICIPHDVNACYVRISQDIYARIEMRSTKLECIVNISTEYRQDLEKATGRTIDIDNEKIVTDPYKQLYGFAKLWLRTMDSIGSAYDTGTKVTNIHRITVAIPPSVRQDDNEEAIEQSLGYPEIEAATNIHQSFELIGGMTNAKQQLTDIIDAIKDPIGAAAYGINSSHFALYGPPGNGKSILIEAFAAKLPGADLYRISSTAIVSKYVGKSAKKAEAVFAEAKQRSQYGTVVMFFDEIDALVSQIRSGSSERTDVIKIFNVEIDDISKNYANRIIIAGATNKDIDDLEPSIMRSGRIEPIAVNMPTEVERQDIWQAIMAESYLSFNSLPDELDDTVPSPFVPYLFDEFDPIALAKVTDGMTGADFKNILSRARKKHYRQYRETGIMGQVSQADILYEITHFYQR